MLTLHLAILLLLILLNGFFAMAEIALVSARPARLQPRAAEGSAGAQAALELKADPSRLLATVQIGITIIAVLTGTFGEATLGESLQDYLAAQGGSLARYAHAISMAVVVIGISYFSLILGELVPKRLALLRPEPIAAALARFMRGMARAAAPGCCRCAAAPLTSPTRRSASCCAKGWRPAISHRPRRRSSRWRCGSATGGSARS